MFYIYHLPVVHKSEGRSGVAASVACSLKILAGGRAAALLCGVQGETYRITVNVLVSLPILAPLAALVALVCVCRRRDAALHNVALLRRYHRE